MRDPNWLYTAVIGASTTLTAILGGLLTTVAIAKKAELERIERRQRALKREDAADDDIIKALHDQLTAIRSEIVDENHAIWREYLLGRRDADEMADALGRVHDEAKQRRLSVEHSVDALEQRNREREHEWLQMRDDLTYARSQFSLIISGIQATLVLALVGIAVPITMLPADPAHRNPTKEGIMQIAFLVALAYVFRVLIQSCFWVPDGKIRRGVLERLVEWMVRRSVDKSK